MDKQKTVTFCLISFGANLRSETSGPRATLERSVEMLQTAGLRLVRRSRWYSSPAFPAGSGPDYVNGAGVFETDITDPDAVLALLHQTEQALGRERKSRWGARLCDLDLLAFGDCVQPDADTLRHWIDLPLSRQMTEAPDQLLLPHPRMQDRAFVLLPLAEIAPDWCHPLLGLNVREMCDALPAAEKAALRPVSDQ